MDPRKALKVLLLVAPAVVAAVGTLSLYVRPIAVLIDFERSNEGPFLGAGFHGRERVDGKAFRWTGEAAFLELGNLPSNGELSVEARLKIIRPGDVRLPLLMFSLDGATVHQAPGAPGENVYRFRSRFRGPRLRLGIHADTFLAGDGRNLGAQVLSVALRARGERSSAPPAVTWMSAAAGCFLVAGLASGWGVNWSVRAALAVTLGFLYLLGRDGVRYTDYPLTVLALGVFAVGLAVVLRGLLALLRWPEPSRRPAAVAVVLLAALLRFGLVTYPLMVSSDADFQANRLSEFLGGNWFVTSVSQHDPPFRIPYPVALYALSAPWVAAGVDRVTVLMVVTALFDVAVGLALIFLADRFLKDLRAGLIAAAVYALAPVNVYAFSAGNFTNLFGVAVTFLFLAVLVAGSQRVSVLGLGGVFSLLALTAHFSTFLMGLVLWPLWLMVLFTFAPEGQRLSRAWVTVVAVSTVVALIYYAGYWPLVGDQWQRVLTRTYATGDAAVAGPLAKLAFNVAFYREQLGLVWIVLALVGAVPVLSRPRASRLHLAMAVWVAVTALFLVVDLTTALEVRYVLQATPLLALFAAACVSSIWQGGFWGRTLASAALAYLGFVGLTAVHAAMLYRYH